ncbi:MAG: F0F1 ATP synthase subunit B [Candidatus Marinimicrobia bacterium]|jgi:F-type H+-transporting ATPase subunit b|nr:F0F1 ATP synthase subunit B [Candidatus Neomarinimicrobiota bacterium]MBT3796178.1 F0F1 ATP synthase subunit B [Candidatus Neomarinimicrobiota bacterium]MBT4149297.1 F0F1 ATP synthase subunit B [Candidatus Neomarinimicrobiota bacterium]MBT4784703.1 F0F1 ATP synthase subunit B [Candidatus Neomarinimicrobiota bacterium]MBT7424118.1 F0F1 ATP synthase subunit B [Candidatus Neomarinimicrobiota bacterium]
MDSLVKLDPGLFIWTIITFLLLFFVLAKYAWKPLIKMLDDRESMIRSSLDDAEKAKLELERLNKESEAITAKARSEAQAILAESKTVAEKVKEDTIAKAKEQAIKISDDAQKQIQVEKDKAITDIKQEVVNLTLSVAEKLINKNLNDADNKSLIEESLKKVKSYEA